MADMLRRPGRLYGRYHGKRRLTKTQRPTLSERLREDIGLHSGEHHNHTEREAEVPERFLGSRTIAAF